MTNPVRAQLAIVGLPGTGKTTLATALGAALGLPVLHTDDFKALPWDVQAAAALEAAPQRGIVEGVTVARLFRRGFVPDCVVHLVGNGGRTSAGSMRSLIQNGLHEYTGRVLHVPERPSVEDVLRLLGTKRACTVSGTSPLG